MRAVLVDAGPLVALLDRSDDHHDEIMGAMENASTFQRFVRALGL